VYDYLTIRQLVSALSATLRETLPKIVPFSLPRPRVPITIISVSDRSNFVARIVKGFNLMEFQFRNFIDFKGYLHIANNVNDEHFSVV
jgi:hypothetical protein